MEVVNKVYPDEDQKRGFPEPGVEGPICMIDLLNIGTVGFTVQWLDGPAS